MTHVSRNKNKFLLSKTQPSLVQTKSQQSKLITNKTEFAIKQNKKKTKLN